MEKKTVKIGTVGVDAGLLWVGDPCYILHQTSPPEDIGKNWHEFVEKMTEEYRQFNYDGGYPGLGVAFSTGYGDGEYDVIAEMEDGRIKEVRIKFF